MPKKELDGLQKKILESIVKSSAIPAETIMIISCYRPEKQLGRIAKRKEVLVALCSLNNDFGALRLDTGLYVKHVIRKGGYRVQLDRVIELCESYGGNKKALAVLDK